MIRQEVFTEAWIDNKVIELRKMYKSIDPILLEKVTKAMYLLECLSTSQLSFVFKGGTSIILLIGAAKRFSIDIDIIVGKNINIEQYLNNMLENNNVFNRFDEDIRNKQGSLPVVHYKLYYHSIIDGRENYILLDVLFEEDPYSETIDTPITCNLIDVDEPVMRIKTPSVDSILGDKLTAFAPNTTGVRFEVDKELEIIKQLYDIGSLFDVCRDLNVVRKTFIQIAQNQIAYRSLKNIDYHDVLEDVFATSMILVFRGREELHKFKQLENGIKKMRGYVLGSKSFIMEEAIACATKTAYLSMLLKCGHTEIERFDERINLIEFKVNSKLINGIKKFSPEAFYYLYKALSLREVFAEVAATSEE